METAYTWEDAGAGDADDDAQPRRAGSGALLPADRAAACGARSERGACSPRWFNPRERGFASANPSTAASP